MRCIVFAVSENKVLCHPASVDSLTTSAGTEDHVSMGGWAARKVLQVVKNVEYGNFMSYFWHRITCSLYSKKPMTHYKKKDNR